MLCQRDGETEKKEENKGDLRLEPERKEWRERGRKGELSSGNGWVDKGRYGTVPYQQHLTK